ncbi:hypothetical protein DICPUDRAFT_148520 [Dictyostelium purpureum]|uniref:Uncharacterized protein n=1 Tax=Dictyostelium purpureum TaxID=5786 RepID=F0ZBB8_DICPU|nr:uncharacterized protein DICPUDRAFT_148520 [Dictyostelium purpureum]EGC38718.1 hypothetical protein DICPUDRAFT_148520 [Dictyostelium purpureum]|eukprot:XP_003284709.1 hypothetical protein DICPUDRAFT_148520 [Dictyostelium purpureum]
MTAGIYRQVQPDYIQRHFEKSYLKVQHNLIRDLLLSLVSVILKLHSYCEILF